LFNLFLCLCISFVLFSCKSNISETKIDQKSFKIAFGSCIDQNKSLDILDTVLLHQPDVFVFLGDNIYADTREVDVMKYEYNKLKTIPSFNRLVDNVKVLATWDDHDFGENDAGKYFPLKNASKEIFLDFWNVPDSSERRNHKGVYDAVILKFDSLIIQFILLDTRTFRDTLIKNIDRKNKDRKYLPVLSHDATFLGKNQWLWLAKQLQIKADVRIIASSVQFSNQDNGGESWSNFPGEKDKFLQLINDVSADAVLFISGDVHFGEISKLQNKITYPIYDVTSSSLSQREKTPKENSIRVGKPVSDNNFGLIEINNSNPVSVSFKLINKSNVLIQKYQIPLSDISF
jgi:alkaline phosphatase D